MDCSACGYANRDAAKFCAQCAALLTRACTSCDSELSPGAKFCDQCGTPVAEATSPAPRADPAVTRRVVTVLFADLVGSTSFGEQVDAESAHEVLADYHVMARAVIESAGGSVAKFAGDGVMALFGVPEIAEDDADRAVAAGIALQRGFAPIHQLVRDRHGTELGLRVGINTGELVLADGDTDVVGDAVNIAARLEAACAPGEVLVGEDTWRLTRSHIRYEVLGEVEVKGKDLPIATFQVADDDIADEQATPFVGRVAELARLRDAFDRAVGQRSALLATVIGAPGVGKTRIAGEFCESVADGTSVAVLRCERAGTATFAPIADLLRSITDVDDASDPNRVTAGLRELVAELDDADRVADLLASFLGAAPARSTEEAFLAVRRLVEAAARRQPLVIVVDDIQWAEPLFLDLLEHLADWVDDAPALLIGLARPELRELRPSLAAENRTVAAAIALEGLDAEATAELAARLVGADSLPSELIARLPDSTEGNPLFVRELMRMLVDDGVIEESDDGWQLTIDADAVEVPPTIQSLLAARLDRMPATERRLVELASVVGPEFALGAVAAISDAGPADLRLSLERLRRRELVEPTGTFWGDEPVYRFHHVLIRDAAYRRLLKRARADLHRRVGEWTERSSAGLPGEHEVTIGYHFEHAHEYGRQLGDADDATAAIGRRSAELFAVAAERSLERDDLPAAANLAERALARLDDGDTLIPSMLIVSAEALLGLGDVARGRPVVEQLSALVADEEHLEPWADAFEAQLTMLTEPERLRDADAQAERAALRLAELGDEAGVAKARLVRAGALARLGQIGRCESELDQALTAARSAGDRRRVAAVLGAAPLAALWGPSPIPRAGGRCLDVIRLLRITTGSPAVEATSVRCQAVLEALRGRFDTARTMLADSRATVEELGLTHSLGETDLFAGIVELLAGEPAAAEAPLRAAYERLGRLGIGSDAGQAAAHLARSLLQQGRLDEAEALAAESADLAGENPRTAIAASSAQAEILAAQGRFDEAVELARDAVARAEGKDIIVDHAAASAVLARVAGLAGDTATADLAARTAAELYDQKAATVAAPADHLAPRAAVSRPDQAVYGVDAIEPASARNAVEIDHATGDDEPQPRNEADRLARRFVELFTAGDRDSWLAMVAPHQETHDRRPVVGVDTEGADGVADAYPRDEHTNEMTSTVETVAIRGESLALVRWKAVSGSGREWDSYHLTRWNEDGQNEFNIIFPPDQLDEAMAELDRLDGADAGDPAEPETEAGTPAEQGRPGALRTESSSASAAIADGAVLIDEAGESFRPEPAQRREVLAVRGERLALVHVVGEDRWFHVEETDSGGEVVAVQRFAFDRLAPAAVALERRWLELEGDGIADSARVLCEYRIAQNERDLDRLFPMLADDHAVTDHRPFGWPALSRDDVIAASEATKDVHDSALISSEVIAVADNAVMVRTAFWSSNIGTELTLGLAGFGITHVHDGQVGAIEIFAEDDEEMARARFDELAGLAAPTSWNEADRWSKMFFGRLMDPADDGWPELLDADHLEDDRRSVVGGGVISREKFIELWSGRQASPGYDLRLDTVATRGDDLVLYRLTMLNDGITTEFLQIERWTSDGLMDRMIPFDADAMDAAIDELNRLWYEGLSERRQRMARLGGLLGLAWAAPSTHDFDALLAPEFELVDGRTLGMGSLDRAGVETALLGREADGAFGAPVASRVTFVSDDVMVFRANNLGHTPGSGIDWEEIACNVMVVDGDRIARLEMFDEDHWDEAIARALELAGPAGLDNAAVRWTVDLMSRGGRYAVEHLTEDFVRDDRRSGLSAAPANRDEFMASTEVQLGQGASYTWEPVAIRGDRLAICRIDAHFDENWVGFLSVIEVADETRIRRMTHFDPDDRGAAQDELDARYLDELTPAQAATLRPGLRFRDAFSARGTDDLEAVMAPGFVAVDHRSMAWPDLDHAGFVDANRERDELLGPALVFTTDIHRIEGDLVVASNRMSGISPDSGAEWLQEFVNIFICRDGQVHGLENFAADDLAGAMARADELLAYGDDRSNEHTVTMVLDRFRAAGGMLGAEAFAADFVREDRRSVISAGVANREEYLRAVDEFTQMGANFTIHPVIAVRGQRCALVPLTVEIDGSLTEFLQVSEVDAQGRVRRNVQFDPDDLTGALEGLDEVWLATLDPADAETYRVAAATLDAYDRGDVERLDALLADDYRAVDHRSMGFGDLDREAIIALSKNRQTTKGSGSTVRSAVHHVGGGVVVWSFESDAMHADGTATSNSGVHVSRVADGQLVEFEIFDDEHFDTAMARAEELATAGPERWGQTRRVGPLAQPRSSS